MSDIKNKMTVYNYGIYLRSSGVLFTGFFIASILNYVFSALMGRMLTVEFFGEVVALTGLLTILSVPASAVALFFAKQISSYKAKGEHQNIHALMGSFKTKVSFFAFAVWVIFLACIPFFATYLNGVPMVALLIFSCVIPIVALSSVYLGVLQGVENFFACSLQTILVSLSKIFFAVIFVIMGLSVSGVMLSLLFSFLLSYGYLLVKTKKVLQSLPPSEDAILFHTKDRNQSIVAIFFATFFLAIFLNIDVIVAKHLLPVSLAGQYAALSTVGKIIVYASGAFHTVLVPLISAAHAMRNTKREINIFLASLALVTIVSGGVTLVFYFFPDIVMRVLFGARYVIVGEHLALFGIAMSCMSFVTLFVYYFIAIRDGLFPYLLAIGTIVQTVLLYQYHQSMRDIVMAMLMGTGFLLALMIFNYVVIRMRSS